MFRVEHRGARLMARVWKPLAERLEREGFVTVAEGSRRTSLTERVIRNWVRAGSVAAKRVGGIVFVEIESLNRAAGMEASQ